MHRPGGAHQSPPRTPAHPPGWPSAATLPSPPPLVLPVDQPGAQQRLPAAIILLTGAYEPHSALQFLWRASPSPRWASSALSGDLASASPLLSFSPHKPDPSVPTLNLPHVLIETLEGSSPKHLPRVRTEFGPPKASQTPNEARRITPGEGGGRRGPRLSRQKSQNPDRTRPSLLLISVQISVSGGSSARAM